MSTGTSPLPLRVALPPIRVAPKLGKIPASLKRKRWPSALFDNHVFANPHQLYQPIRPESKAGHLIRKRSHPAPNINSVDLHFAEEFDHHLHERSLSNSLVISHLTLTQYDTLISLIKQYWRIFSKKVSPSPLRTMSVKLPLEMHRLLSARKLPLAL